MHTRVSYVDGEGKIPEDILRKIKRKKTDKSWVLAHLGEPHAIDRVETDEMNPKSLLEVYTFRFSKAVTQSGHAFFILRAGGIEESTEYFHVAFENERVKKSWIDRFPRPQIGTRVKHAKITRHRVPTTSKAVTQSKGSTTDWKIPIFKKWLSSGSIKNTSNENEMSEGHAKIQEDAVLDVEPNKAKSSSMESQSGDSLR